MTENKTFSWADPISEKAMGSNPDIPGPIMYSRALDAHTKIIYAELRRLRRAQMPALDSPADMQLFDFDHIVKISGIPADAVKDRLLKLMIPLRMIRLDGATLWRGGLPTKFAIYGIDKPFTYLQAVILWPNHWLDTSVGARVCSMLHQNNDAPPFKGWAKGYNNEATDPWYYLEKLK